MTSQGRWLAAAAAAREVMAVTRRPARQEVRVVCWAMARSFRSSMHMALEELAVLEVRIQTMAITDVKEGVERREVTATRAEKGIREA